MIIKCSPQQCLTVTTITSAVPRGCYPPLNSATLLLPSISSASRLLLTPQQCHSVAILPQQCHSVATLPQQCLTVVIVPSAVVHSSYHPLSSASRLLPYPQQCLTVATLSSAGPHCKYPPLSSASPEVASHQHCLTITNLNHSRPVVQLVAETFYFHMKYLHCISPRMVFHCYLSKKQILIFSLQEYMSK